MGANGVTRALTPARASLALGGLTAVEVAAGCVLTVLAHDLRASFDGVLLLIIAIVAAVGRVITRRQPSNPIGWMLLVASVFFAGYAVAVLYAVLDYHHHGGRLPLGRVALAAEPCWVPGFVLLGLAVALFPDGRLASKRWRIPLVVYVAAGAWFCCVWSLSQATLHVGAGFDVDEVGNYIGEQGGFSGTVAGIAWAASPIILLLLTAFVIRQAATWRRATGERRKQLTWLMTGGALSVVAIYLVSTNNTSSAGRAITDIAAVGLTGIPLAIGVGILKYKLYEIDRLISRTLSYLVITGLLVAVFLGLVALTTSVLPFSSPRRRGRLDARRGSTLQPGAPARATPRRPTFQPRRLRRRHDHRCVYDPAPRRRRPRHDQPRTARSGQPSGRADTRLRLDHADRDPETHLIVWDSS